MAPFKKSKYPDLDSGPRKKLCLPKTKKAIKKQGEPVMKKLREGYSTSDLNTTEKHLKIMYEQIVRTEKYETETGEVACWTIYRKGHKDQENNQHKEDRNRKRSPTPIKANDDNEELILGDFENGNMIDSAMSFEEPVISSTRIGYDMGSGGADIDSKEISFSMGTLANIGNTCYMNAALYSLRFIPGFLHNLHHLLVNLLYLCDEFDLYGTPPENACARERATAELISNQDEWPDFDIATVTEKRRIIDQLHAVYSKLARLDNENEKLSLRPFQFQKYAQYANPIFVRGTQQDSHEMILCILDSLQDCSKECWDLVNNHQDIFPITKGDPATLLSFNYFNENFVGNCVSKLRCITCESVRTIQEVVVDLTVPLTSEMTTDENFIKHSCLKDQIFQASEKVRCEQCVRQCEMRQTFSYQKLPKIMIVHLGRFDNQMKKVNIPTPTPFNFDCFCIECMDSGTSVHQYSLVSVILHLGSTLKSGHYISYVRSPTPIPKSQSWCESQKCCQVNMKMNGPDRTNNQWFICDDHRITPISEKDLQQKLKTEAQFKTPYLLFYVRNDIPAEE